MTGDINGSEPHQVSLVLAISFPVKLRCGVHRSPFTVHRSPFAVHRLPFTVHRSPFTVRRRRSLFTVHRSPFAGRRSPVGRKALEVQASRLTSSRAGRPNGSLTTLAVYGSALGGLLLEKIEQPGARKQVSNASRFTSSFRWTPERRTVNSER